jgi:hypothetical protein
MDSRVERMVKMTNEVLVGKLLSGTLSCKTCILQNEIKINTGELMFQYVDWIQLSQERFRWRIFVNTRINLHSVFLKTSNFLETCNSFNVDTAAFGY